MVTSEKQKLSICKNPGSNGWMALRRSTKTMSVSSRNAWAKVSLTTGKSPHLRRQDCFQGFLDKIINSLGFGAGTGEGLGLGQGNFRV